MLYKVTPSWLQLVWCIIKFWSEVILLIRFSCFFFSRRLMVYSEVIWLLGRNCNEYYKRKAIGPVPHKHSHFPRDTHMVTVAQLWQDEEQLSESNIRSFSVRCPVALSHCGVACVFVNLQSPQIRDNVAWPCHREKQVRYLSCAQQTVKLT